MIDTHVPGTPADIRAAGAYLTDTLSGGITALADTVVAQRAALQRGWEGQAGAAFTRRATILARAGDDVSEAAEGLGGQIEALASVLDIVQLGMAALRAEAAAAGLTVQGTRVLPPRAGPHAPGTPGLAAAHVQAAAYDAAVLRRDELAARWDEALGQTADLLQTNATTVAQLTVNLLVAGYSSALLSRAASVMSRQAIYQLAEAGRLATYAEDLAAALRSERVSPYRGYYAEVDELMARSGHAAEQATDAAAAARSPRLPSGLTRGLGVLGPLAAAYGVYDDVGNGESTEQAVASQGGGLLSGMVTGGATGAAIGTMGFPVVGTIAGAVVGGVTGVVVSNQIDHHYEDDAAVEAEAQAQADEAHLVNMLTVSEGLPLYATPGSNLGDGTAP